jgi:aerobic-type carbon monoxide dehydrogenase small subunit (CoxS/CutS family)
MNSSKEHNAPLRVSTLRRGQPIQLWLDGELIDAYPGETVAAVLVASGRRAFRTSLRGLPRGLYCGIGLCHECLVTVDGSPGVRACMTQVFPGMRIETREPPAKGGAG